MARPRTIDVSAEPISPAAESKGGPRRRTAAEALFRAATLALASLAVLACTTDVDLGGGVRQRGDHLFISEGPELEALLGTHEAPRSLGDPWLVLAAELRGSAGGGPVTVRRSGISVRTPDGRRLPLVGQAEYAANYGRVRIAVERSLAALPTIGRFDTSQLPCDRWFLTDPFGGFASDEVYLNTFQTCWGPLVFHDPGGIQPGRWRLVIELEESRVDIPFEVEAPESTSLNVGTFGSSGETWGRRRSISNFGFRISDFHPPTEQSTVQLHPVDSGRSSGSGSRSGSHSGRKQCQWQWAATAHTCGGVSTTPIIPSG